MFSVPYNLNSYDSYLAVGVSGVYLNSSDGGVFKTLYYYSGSFQRSKAGRMAEYQSDKGEEKWPAIDGTCYVLIQFLTKSEFILLQKKVLPDPGPESLYAPL